MPESVMDREILALSAQVQFWSAGGELGYTDCAGYKVPPILGGEVVAANLETTDMGVNWHLSRQIREQTAGIDPGSPTGPFEVRD